MGNDEIFAVADAVGRIDGVDDLFADLEIGLLDGAVGMIGAPAGEKIGEPGSSMVEVGNVVPMGVAVGTLGVDVVGVIDGVGDDNGADGG